MVSIVCVLSLLRNDCMFSSDFSSIGRAAYCVLALHLKLEFATAREASATTLVPAVVVGYLCVTPLAKALQSTW